MEDPLGRFPDHGDRAKDLGMVTEPPSPEAALLLRVAQRDQAALSELYDRTRECFTPLLSKVCDPQKKAKKLF